eukprot:scpid101448/ scgid14253/ GTPase IMAP family member 7; Immunity-associated nucleotide 7 protein
MASSFVVDYPDDTPKPGPDTTDKPDRVVVLVGSTGSGKSTLANVIAGKPDLFGESSRPVSCTKDLQSELVHVKCQRKKPYLLKIVDTCGLEDTDRDQVDVLNDLCRLTVACPDGIHLVIIVTSGRIKKNEQDCFEILQNVIFSPAVVHHMCIVYTHFQQYDDAAAMTRSERDLRDHSALASKVKKFLFVECPSEKTPAWKDLAIDAKRTARLRVLSYLINKCEQVYSPEELRTTRDQVGEYIDRQNGLSRQIRVSELNNLSGEVARLNAELRKEKRAAAKQMKKRMQYLQQWEAWGRLGFFKRMFTSRPSNDML